MLSLAALGLLLSACGVLEEDKINYKSAAKPTTLEIPPDLTQLRKDAGLAAQAIDGIAYTQGPGLSGALLVGTSVAEALAFTLGVPTIGVHHLEGHLLAPLLEESPPQFPFVALLVSGGHTQLMRVSGIGEYELLGDTLDDAAGEAFDKTAKLLDLSYPGGPAVSQLAEQGVKGKFKLPRSMLHSGDLNFSFSGLKTSILYFLQNAGKSLSYKEELIASKEEKQKFIAENLADICASIQDRIVSILLNKLKKAAIQTGVKDICLAGGVSANSGLRNAFKELCNTNGWNAHVPDFEYCTDNAGMIAITAYYKFLAGEFTSLDTRSSAKAGW